MIALVVILVRIISPYSVRMRENANQNNSECGHFWRSGNDAIEVYVDLLQKIKILQNSQENTVPESLF